MGPAMNRPPDTLLARSAHAALRAALDSDMGIEVRVVTNAPMINQAQRGRQVLYRYKKLDAAFADLHIRVSPDDPDHCLWIIRADVAVAPTPEEPHPSNLITAEDLPFDFTPSKDN